MRVTAQVTGEFLQLVPSAAHLGVLAGEGVSPGGLAGDGPAAGAVQHQVGGARVTPRVDHEAAGMLIKPLQVTAVIVGKTLHAAHHPHCRSTLSAACHSLDRRRAVTVWLRARGSGSVDGADRNS
jgi:hypothetical protein